MEKLTPLYTIKELADLLRVSPKTIYYWSRRREIPYVKVGRHLRFVPHEVIEFFKENSLPHSLPCLMTQVPLTNAFTQGSLKTSLAAHSLKEKE